MFFYLNNQSFVPPNKKKKAVIFIPFQWLFEIIKYLEWLTKMENKVF